MRKFIIFFDRALYFIRCQSQILMKLSFYSLLNRNLSLVKKASVYPSYVTSATPSSPREIILHVKSAQSQRYYICFASSFYLQRVHCFLSLATDTTNRRTSFQNGGPKHRCADGATVRCVVAAAARSDGLSRPRGDQSDSTAVRHRAVALRQVTLLPERRSDRRVQ